MLHEGLVWKWEEGLMYNSACATANCQHYSSGLSEQSQRTNEKQSWLQCRVKHDLGKSLAVTGRTHILYIIYEVCMVNYKTETCTWIHVLYIYTYVIAHLTSRVWVKINFIQNSKFPNTYTIYALPLCFHSTSGLSVWETGNKAAKQFINFTGTGFSILVW